jgi:exodeoxyribonuclease VII small subunit
MAKAVGKWSDAASELDAIVSSFDDGDVTVDDLIEKLTRAGEIIEALEERLTSTRAKVEELMPKITRGGDEQ